MPPSRNPHSRGTQPTSLIEASVSSVTPGSGGQHGVVEQAQSSTEPQRRYTKRRAEGDASASINLSRLEATNQTLFRALVNKILDKPPPVLPNGCLKLSQPDMHKVTAGIVELLTKHMDLQALDACHEAYRSYRPEHLASVEIFLREAREAREAKKEQQRVTGHSFSQAMVQQPVDQIPPFRSHVVLPPLDISVIDVANASGYSGPMSATESAFSSEGPSSTTLSNREFVHYFPPDYHQVPNATHMYETDFDQQGGMLPQSSSESLYPLPMSASRQTGNSGGMMYPGYTHPMSGTVPHPPHPLPYPHQFGSSEEVPQAGASHTIPDYPLPHQSFSSEVTPADVAYTNPYYFSQNTQAASTRSKHPQSRHQSTAWHADGESSQSKTYPPY